MALMGQAVRAGLATPANLPGAQTRCQADAPLQGAMLTTPWELGSTALAPMAFRGPSIGLVPWPLAHAFRRNATCRIPTVRGVRSALAMRGFEGNITWNLATPVGSCAAVPCLVTNSNGMPGTGCACKSGFAGTIRWAGVEVDGTCDPAPCSVPNSNMVSGEDCKCKDGFAGLITWNGVVASGACHPAPCNVENSNYEDGLRCSCKDNYVGSISWDWATPVGYCTMNGSTPPPRPPTAKKPAIASDSGAGLGDYINAILAEA